MHNFSQHLFQIPLFSFNHSAANTTPTSTTRFMWSNMNDDFFLYPSAPLVSPASSSFLYFRLITTCLFFTTHSTAAAPTTAVMQWGREKLTKAEHTGENNKNKINTNCRVLNTHSQTTFKHFHLEFSYPISAYRNARKLFHGIRFFAPCNHTFDDILKHMDSKCRIKKGFYYLPFAFHPSTYTYKQADKPVKHLSGN